MQRSEWMRRMNQLNGWRLHRHSSVPRRDRLEKREERYPICDRLIDLSLLSTVGSPGRSQLSIDRDLLPYLVNHRRYNESFSRFVVEYSRGRWEISVKNTNEDWRGKVLSLFSVFDSLSIEEENGSHVHLQQSIYSSIEQVTLTCMDNSAICIHPLLK